MFGHDICMKNVFHSSLTLTPANYHDITAPNLDEARTDFATLLGNEHLNEDLQVCAAHAWSRWSESSPSHRASLILYPKTTDHASAILRVCHRRLIPVTPCSGGTGLSGSIAATRGGICIDFSLMSKIWNLHEEVMDVSVQPGVGWMDLNA